MDRVRQMATDQELWIAEIDHQAHDRGITLMRADCWADANGKLVDYYRGAGFTPTVGFTHHGWPGQVLQQKLPLSSPPR